MNDDTYTPCTKCGRPMAYCKGKCGCKRCGCDCKEYGPAVCGAIRPRQPECPYTAVIPSITVERPESLRDLCDTFVHVSDINTTFYIDDKHRTIITWAGPVEYDNYNLALNQFGLRSQFLIDFANNRGAYYDKTGNYKVFSFGLADEPLSVTLHFDDSDPGSWSGSAHGYTVLITDEDETYECTKEIPDVTFTDDATGLSIAAEAVFNALESGRKVIFNNVPLGIDYSSSPVSIPSVGGVSFSAKQDFGGGSSIYTGVASVVTGESRFLPLGFIFGKNDDGMGNVSYYVMVDGTETQGRIPA